MDLDKYLSFTTEEIILDKDFTTWVLHPDKESDSFWERFLDEHPELRPRIREAAFIVRSLQPVEPQTVHAGVEDVLQRIKLDISARKRQVLFSTLKYAAGLLMLAGLGFAIFSLRHKVSQFPVAAVDAGSLNRGRIILADGSSHEFDTKQTIIQQTDSGIVMVNNDTIGRGRIRTKLGEAAMNRVIIPYGKRSAITLADGTHIWMNSGSQLSYPAEFKKDSREVYLSGEAFFDVRHDPDKPFYVITQEFRIKVLARDSTFPRMLMTTSPRQSWWKERSGSSKMRCFQKHLNWNPGKGLYTAGKTAVPSRTMSMYVSIHPGWTDS